MQVLPDDETLLLDGGIVDDSLDHETVDLCLGQLVGTLLLDGVLGCHDEEWVGQREGMVADGDLVLLHGLEQCALHLCRSAVDFVGEHEVGEHRSLLHMEILVFLRVDHRSHHIGRQEVGSELNAAVLCIDELGERLDGQCLCQSRHALKEYMPITEQSDEESLDEVFLTYDHPVHSHGEIGDECALLFDPQIKFADVN